MINRNQICIFSISIFFSLQMAWGSSIDVKNQCTQALRQNTKNDVSQLLQQAFQLRENKQHAAALEVASKILEIHPHQLDALKLKLTTSYQLRFNRDVVLVAPMILSLDPQFKVAYGIYSQALIRLHDYQKAIEVLDRYEKIIEDDYRKNKATQDRAQSLLGNTSSRITKSPKSEDHYHRNREYLLLSRVKAYLGLGNLKMANLYLTDLLRMDANRPQFVSLAAQTAIEMAMPNLALQYAEQILAISPLDEIAMSQKITALELDKRTDEALRFSESMLKNNPENIVFQNQAMLLNLKLGNVSRAYEILQTTTKQKPTIYFAIALVALQKRKATLSRAVIEKLIFDQALSVKSRIMIAAIAKIGKFEKMPQLDSFYQRFSPANFAEINDFVKRLQENPGDTLGVGSISHIFTKPLPE